MAVVLRATFILRATFQLSQSPVRLSLPTWGPTHLKGHLSCFRPASLRAALRAWRIFFVPSLPFSGSSSVLQKSCCRGPLRVGFRTYVSNAASMRPLCRSCSPYLLQGPFPRARLLQSRNLACQILPDLVWPWAVAGPCVPAGGLRTATCHAPCPNHLAAFQTT